MQNLEVQRLVPLANTLFSISLVTSAFKRKKLIGER